MAIATIEPFDLDKFQAAAEVRYVPLMEPWSLVSVLNSNGTHTRHLVGRANDQIRFTSEIVSMDWRLMLAATKSGRLYEVSLKPGRDGEAHGVMSRWLKQNRATLVRDHSQAISRLMRYVKNKHGSIPLWTASYRFDVLV